jgi:hypothetical protein
MKIETPISDRSQVDAGYIIASHSSGDFVPLEVSQQLETDLNIWRSRAAAHEENYKEMLKRIDVLVLEKKELSAYADKLADGLPEGMLPMDIENIREANTKFAGDISRALEKLETVYRNINILTKNGLSDDEVYYFVTGAMIDLGYHFITAEEWEEIFKSAK